MVYRLGGFSKEYFSQVFNYYWDAPASAGAHIFKGPDWCLFARHCTKEDYPEAPDDYWYIEYASSGCGMADFSRHAPYELPYVAFARPLKGRKDLKFYRYDRIRGLCFGT